MPRASQLGLLGSSNTWAFLDLQTCPQAVRIFMHTSKTGNNWALAEIIKRTTIIKTATRHFLTQQMGLVSCICTKEVYMKQLEGFSSSDGEHFVQAKEIHIWIETSLLSIAFEIP